LTDDNKTFCGTENCILLPCQKEWILNGNYNPIEDMGEYFCEKSNKMCAIYFDNTTRNDLIDFYKRLTSNLFKCCKDCKYR